MQKDFCSNIPVKADKSQSRRSLEQAAYQRGECGKRSTLSEESEGEERKGRSRREPFERLNVGRPEMFGGLWFRTFLDRWATTAGRYEGAAAEKAVPFPSAARRSQVPSLWCDQPGFNRRYWCLGGVVHERDLSIKQDKERAESGDGP